VAAPSSSDRLFFDRQSRQGKQFQGAMGREETINTGFSRLHAADSHNLGFADASTTVIVALGIVALIAARRFQKN